MTPGNNGASTPEDDDPFGYLYEDGQARGAQPPSGGYGYPNSVNRVRAVGDRRPAGPQQTAAYGQAPQGYGQPPQQYGIPQQQGAYGPPQQGLHQGPPAQQPPRSAGRGSGGGRGPNTKGLLIGAVAVVVAVVVGIVVAVSLGDKKDDEAGGGTTPAPQASTSESASESDSGSSSTDGELPPVTDAKAMKLDGGAVTSSAVKGAKAGDGIYVDGFNNVGAKVTWTVNGITGTGSYRLYVRYSIPGIDANATVSVNGKPNAQPLGMKNFIKSPEGDFGKGWQSTWAPVTLAKGTNVLEVSCMQGNQCNAYIDQMWLEKS